MDNKLTPHPDVYWCDLPPDEFASELFRRSSIPI